MIPQTKRRIQLFNNADNINKTINLKDSAYNYSYLYIEGDTNLHYVIVQIFSATQSNFRGIGGWAGSSTGNAVTTHIMGTINNKGKTLNIESFLSMVHNSASMHAESIERFCKRVIGIK